MVKCMMLSRNPIFTSAWPLSCFAHTIRLLAVSHECYFKSILRVVNQNPIHYNWVESSFSRLTFGLLSNRIKLPFLHTELWPLFPASYPGRSLQRESQLLNSMRMEKKKLHTWEKTHLKWRCSNYIRLSRIKQKNGERNISFLLQFAARRVRRRQKSFFQINVSIIFLNICQEI